MNEKNKQKNANSYKQLIAEDPTGFVDSVFYCLVDGTPGDKNWVRDVVTTADWFDGNAILLLFAKIQNSDRAGWGRSKRNAISNWYLKRDLNTLMNQVSSTDTCHRYSHSDVIKKMHLIEKALNKQDSKRLDFFLQVTDLPRENYPTSGQGKNRPTENENPSGFWSWVLSLFK